MPAWPQMPEARAMANWQGPSHINIDVANMTKNENIARLQMEQLHDLHVIMVIVCSISLAASLIAASWFYRMRRSFRHDLIMLLIHCDIFKSLWFLLFPAVDLAYGKVESASSFCQATGFFTALAIEASDIAVLMIAIHTALYIFRGEQGLYPYRKYAYTIFVVTPIILASLAFVRSPAYFNTGNFCYLPIQPAWVRKTFSWGPRYVTFATILLTYLAIYIYVRLLMRQFGKTEGKRGTDQDLSLLTDGDGTVPPQEEATALPPTPPITYHGLLASRNPSQVSGDPRGRQFSCVSNISTLNIEIPQNKPMSKANPASPRKNDPSVKWNMPNFNLEVPSYHQTPSSEPNVPDSADTCISDEATLATPSEAHLRDSVDELSSSKPATPPVRHTIPARDQRKFSIADTSSMTQSTSVPNLFAVMRRNTISFGNAKKPPDALLQSNGIDVNSVVKTRDRIRRQLRKLFIYPLVYVIVWVLPFIIHLTNYAKGAPFGLVSTSLVFLCAQGLVDAVVFSLKEKPWKHPRRKRFDFRFWKKPKEERYNFNIWQRNSGQEPANPNVGRTREEMAMDQRNAKQRRDAELEDRRVNQQQPPRKQNTDWWDVEHHA